MAHLTRPAEISEVSAGSFPKTAAGNRAYKAGGVKVCSARCSCHIGWCRVDLCKQALISFFHDFALQF